MKPEKMTVKDIFHLAKGLPTLLFFTVLIVGIVIQSIPKFTDIDPGWAPWIVLLIVGVFAIGMGGYMVKNRASVWRDLNPLLGQPLAIGVLSFTEPGADGIEESMGDGFAEELISRLNRLHDIIVKPQHAMLRFKGRKTPIGKIAKELQVNCLVRGELVRDAGLYRVEAEFIQAWDRGKLKRKWKRPESEWFELQGDVAEWIAERLVSISRSADGKSLNPEEKALLQKNPTDKVDANLMFIQAHKNMRDFNRERDPQMFSVAEAEFLHALRQDQSYIEARTMLGFLYLLNWETAGGSRWLEKSEEQFQEVIQKDPQNPVASAELGYLAFIRERVDEGIERVETAAEKYPQNTITQNVRALIHLYLGFYESAVEITKDVILIDPDYIYPPTNASIACYLMGKCAKALTWAEYPERRAPSAFIIHLVEGAAWFCKGEMKSADRAWRRGQKLAPRHLKSLFKVTRAWVYAARGDSAGPKATISDYQNEPWVNGAYGPYFISLCALAGEHDLAVELIGRQVTWGSGYRYLIGDPTLESLRDHPGFRKLLLSRYEMWIKLTDRMQDILSVPTLPTPSELKVGSGKSDIPAL